MFCFMFLFYWIVLKTKRNINISAIPFDYFLFNTLLKCGSLFDTGQNFLPYLTSGKKFFPYMTL
jgi:hypothetical protein